MKATKTVALIVLLVVILAMWLVGHTGAWQPFQVAGLAIMVPTFFLWALARLQLGEAFSVEARASRLVTHGLYSKIRNPVYVFGGLFIVGLLVYMGRPLFFVILLIVVPLQVTRVRKESQVLEAAFGDEYRAYKARTWF